MVCLKKFFLFNLLFFAIISLFFTTNVFGETVGLEWETDYKTTISDTKTNDDIISFKPDSCRIYGSDKDISDSQELDFGTASYSSNSNEKFTLTELVQKALSKIYSILEADHFTIFDTFTVATAFLMMLITGSEISKDGDFISGTRWIFVGTAFGGVGMFLRISLMSSFERISIRTMFFFFIFLVSFTYLVQFFNIINSKMKGYE